MKSVLISVGFAMLLIVGAVAWAGKVNENKAPAPVAAVEKEGKQIIEISAKGGYSPKRISAKAGLESVLQIKTSGTFDCSSALVIPGIGYRGYLPPTGLTEIVVPAQPPGTLLRGLCAMGMYSFEISFN